MRDDTVNSIQVQVNLKLTAGKELRTHLAGDFFMNFSRSEKFPTFSIYSNLHTQ